MLSRRSISILLLLFCVASLPAFAQQAKRALKLDDLFKIKNVSDPRVSPDGQWVAYVVSSTDV
ncbi:MAG: hypothetical protein KA810_01310, partial [Pyrinomonadaceae bacterium]|nr:hypothetical protein [Pyrinomonadaceae bacterium]